MKIEEYSTGIQDSSTYVEDFGKNGDTQTTDID